MINFTLEALIYLTENFVSKPTGITLLDDRYEWQHLVNGAEWPYYRFFYELVNLLTPRLVVELGGYQGTAAAHFAAGCPEATVITIDHHTDPGDEYNKTRMLEVAERFANIVYIQGWTNPELAASQYGKHALGNAPNALPQVMEYGKIDILFIDSWHTYQNARIDFDTYQPLLNSPALVICDDIQAGGDEYSPISGMLRFWEELPGEKFLNATLHPGTNLGFVKC